MDADVAIAGGGPAGLAAAIEIASRGHTALVLERHHTPVDKACGEGLMPAGLSALQRWQVALNPADTAPFSAIRYVQEDGRHVEAQLPDPGGLGVRRLALHQALAARARALGVDVREGVTVKAHAQTRDGITLETDHGPLTAKLLVAADGLHSPLRRAAGLETPSEGPRRFGLRQHFALKPFGSRVEVHFADGLEAYVTPAGQNRIGVAFLWEDGKVDAPISFASMLKRFPLLQQALANAKEDSKAIGAGPLLQQTTALVDRRLLLLGDAAGYVDAITGEGLSLAFDQATLLGTLLPRALTEPAALTAYERQSKQAFRTYALLAGSLVAMARRPTLRRLAINRLIANPPLFSFLLRHLTAP